GPASAGRKAEMNFREMNKELRSQLAEGKQRLRDLKEKLHIPESIAYSLANQLQKYSKFYRFTTLKGMNNCMSSL
uniref:Uncharacterized protein n=1 Tax=Prolemur simus TaxID=1328070 RepID=A0A8C8ZCW4_PROSS